MTHVHPLIRAGALLALAGLIGASHAATVGTAAGTAINNIAELDYSIGGVAQSKLKSCATACTSLSGSNTSFLVDNKIDLLVAIPNTVFVSAYRGATVSGGQAVASFTVTNQGNNVQDFGLAADFSASGAKTVSGFTTPSVTDNFDPTACTAYLEDATAGYQGTEATYIDELASGASATVTVACAIPLSQAKADVAVISLKATALAGGNGASKGAALTATGGANDPAQVDIVFADGAGEAGDLARAADHSAYNAFKVAVAELKTSKTVTTLCDPLNGNSNPRDIPGAFVRYTITITNEGLASDPDATDATLGTLGDTLASALSFDEDLIKGDTAAGCRTGGAPTNGSGKGIAVSVSNTGRTATSIANGSTVYRTGAADTDGAVHASQVLTLDFATLLPADGSYSAGLLKKGGESVTVVFNAKIN